MTPQPAYGTSQPREGGNENPTLSEAQAEPVRLGDDSGPFTEEHKASGVRERGWGEPWGDCPARGGSGEIW